MQEVAGSSQYASSTKHYVLVWLTRRMRWAEQATRNENRHNILVGKLEVKTLDI
jgi:hypothetical protein